MKRTADREVTASRHLEDPIKAPPPKLNSLNIMAMSNRGVKGGPLNELGPHLAERRDSLGAPMTNIQVNVKSLIET